METFLLEICKSDGSTPLGKCPEVEVDAVDRHEARAKVLNSNPGYEVVSCGLKSEIEAYRKRWGAPAHNAG